MTDLREITSPAEEPIAIAEAKAHLNVTIDDDDSLIMRLISAARRAAELYTGRAFINRRYEFAHTWHQGSPPSFVLPRPPLRQVVSVIAFDDSGCGVAVGNYSIQGESDQPATISLKQNAATVVIQFDAGYGDAASVPRPIKDGILSLVAHLYEKRGTEEVHAGPAQALAALAPYRVAP